MKHQGGRRIVRLVRILTAMALIGGATTVAMMGWTLAQFRSERASATAEQTRLRQESDELRRFTVEADKETTFDEDLYSTTPPSAVPRMAAFVRSLLGSRPDSAVVEPLSRTRARLSALAALAARGAAWQARHRAIDQDVSQDRTIGKVRSLIAALRGNVEEYEGRLRLEQAVRYNRWRKSSAQGNAPAIAAALLEQTGRQRQEFTGFGNDLSELARLAEVLNGEVQLDRFADLKDNQLKPIFESLNRAVDTFGSTAAADTPLTAGAVKEIEAAVFGDGYLADDAHQSIQPGHGGLFSLRQEVLRLQRELTGLKREQSAIIRDIDADNAMFAQSAQGRTAALAQQVENRLTAGWWQARIFGVASAAGFLWLAWLITRGIRGQVAAIEQRTAELTRQIAQRELAEQDLRRLRNQQEMIFNAIGEGIHSLDQGGHIIFENPAAARLLGWEGSELLGRPAHSTMHHSRGDGTAYPDSECPVCSGLQNGMARRVDNEVFWRKDGSAFPVEYTTTPLRDDHGQITGTVVVFTDITERKRAEADLERTNRQLRDVSRQAGMAEVATGVLHNVGNVLNSVNVSSSMIASTVRKLRIAGLAKIAAMLVENESDLGAFMTADSRGKLLPGFLSQLSGHLAAEQETILKEVDHLQKNIEHIKEIVNTQQAYASSKGFIEHLDVTALLEAALRMNVASLNAHDITVVRKFQSVGPVPVDKHKVLQILVNLITNARQAMKEAAEKVLTLTLVATAEATVRLSVRDTGCGIAPENLTRVFAHGFTTRTDGHGFGLHSSALAAREMNGSLTLHSDGPGKGAIFTLELPLAASRQHAA